MNLGLRSLENKLNTPSQQILRSIRCSLLRCRTTYKMTSPQDFNTVFCGLELMPFHVVLDGSDNSPLGVFCYFWIFLLDTFLSLCMYICLKIQI